MGISDELRALTDNCNKEMEELGFVRLPVDADGEIIHVGDKLDGYNETTVVKWLTLDKDGWSMTLCRENGMGKPFTAWFNFSRFTHHKATVEDVLREFTDTILEWAGKSGTVAEVGTWSDVAAEYADKLREVLRDE